MTKPSEPESLHLAPAAVLGFPLNVSAALDDEIITGRVAEHSVARGISKAVARRFAGQAAVVIRCFEFECCPSCGRDLGEREVLSDAFGNAHAHCLAGENLS